MSRSLATFTALALTATPALADLGHLFEQGRGHIHWDELLLLAGLAALIIGYGAARLYSHRRSSRA